MKVKNLFIIFILLALTIALTGCNKKNPYEEIQGYDGIYQFTTSWTINEGTVIHSGLLVLYNGKCEIHSTFTRDFNTVITENIFKGFYGIKNGDISTIYLYFYSVNDYSEDVKYKCTIKGKNLECRLLDGEEVTLLTKNDKVEFIYYTGNTDINEIKQQIEKENMKKNDDTTNESSSKKYSKAIDEFKKAELEYNQAKNKIEEIEEKIREESTNESTLKEYSDAIDIYSKAEIKYNQARKNLIEAEDKWREDEQSK